MSVAIEDCPAARVEAVREFFGRAYGAHYVLARDASLFSWQFVDSPAATGDGRLKLALRDDEIRGCLGYIPVDLTFGDGQLRAAWTANWVVDPAERGLGLGPLLLRQLMSEFDVVLTVGLDRGPADLLARMRWTDFGELPRFIRVLEERGARLLTQSGTGAWPMPPEPPAGRTAHGGPMREVDRFDERVTCLWDRLARSGIAGTRRTASFLNWRYADHPSFRYRLFQLDAGGRCAGLAVFRTEQVRDMPVRIGRIVELVGEPDFVPPLVEAIVAGARAEDVALLDVFCSSRQAGAALMTCGFFRSDAEQGADLPRVFQPVDRRRAGIRFMAFLGSRAPEAHATDWYVTSGDGDQDRPN